MLMQGLTRVLHDRMEDGEGARGLNGSAWRMAQGGDWSPRGRMWAKLRHTARHLLIPQHTHAICRLAALPQDVQRPKTRKKARGHMEVNTTEKAGSDAAFVARSLQFGEPRSGLPCST